MSVITGNTFSVIEEEIRRSVEKDAEVRIKELVENAIKDSIVKIQADMIKQVTESMSFCLIRLPEFQNRVELRVSYREVK